MDLPLSETLMLCIRELLDALSAAKTAEMLGCRDAGQRYAEAALANIQWAKKATIEELKERSEEDAAV